MRHQDPHNLARRSSQSCSSLPCSSQPHSSPPRWAQRRWARPLRTAGSLACVAALLAGCATPGSQTAPNTALSSIEAAMTPAERAAPGQPVTAPTTGDQAGTPSVGERSAGAAAAGPATPRVPEAVRALLAPPVQPQAPIAAPQSWLPEPRFDLSVSDAPASQVFLAIANDTRYSMLLPPELPGRVTIELKDVTVPEALEALRELYGYEYRIEGRRVYVLPQGVQTRIFRINYLAVKRRGQSDIRVSTGSLGNGAASAPSSAGTGTGAADTVRGVEASRLVTETEADFWSSVTESLRAIVGEQEARNVIVNPLAGVIVVRATPPELRQVEHFLRLMQISVERQVMLEAKIVEVSLRDGFQSGINWAAFNSAGRHQGSAGANAGAIGLDRSTSGSLAQLLGSGLAATAGRSAEGLFGFAFQTTNFQALINFLESQGRVHVLSSPRIATLNNQKAVLKVGTDDFFVTNITTNTVSNSAGTTSSPTITVQPFFSGIALDVTPQIDDAGNILLHVHPSVSVVAERNKEINLGELGNYRLPLASSSINETDSIVRVPDGNIVAIGGLMTQEQRSSSSEVPGAGELPLFGALFGQRDRSFSKRELVILIRPTVIRSDSDWASDLSGTRSRMSEYRQPVPDRVMRP